MGAKLNLEDRAREAGYGSLEEFFLSEGFRTYKEMAKILGCSWLTVMKGYGKFRGSIIKTLKKSERRGQ